MIIRRMAILALVSALTAFAGAAIGQQSVRGPVTVQPGAPGQPTKVLPAGTRPTLLPISPKDVEFMQGMIMHHAQAVEMTAMIAERTTNKDVMLIGARISQSQADEIAFMKKWLEVRGQAVAMPNTAKSDGHSHVGHGGHTAHGGHSMPGMLSPEQMEALRKAKGTEFDRLFLEGMIQHHEGALAMVSDLFKTSGAGQDGEIFNFATDVDSGQRAEIRSMQALLGRKAEQLKQSEHKHDHE